MHEMKSNPYIGILLWFILTSHSYSMPEVRKTESFTAFNPLPYYQNSIDSYGTQFHRDPLLDSLIRLSSYPSKGGYENLERTISRLQHKVAELNSQRLVCSSLMPAGSKVIGSVCYYVEVSFPANYIDALTKCRSYGGTLVEPLPSFTLSLWNALVKKFPSRMAAISQFWIGASTVPSSTTFTWATTGTKVFPKPQIASVTTQRFIFFSYRKKAQGALMQALGNEWKAANVCDTNPYVCWSSPFKASSRSYGYSKSYAS